MGAHVVQQGTARFVALRAYSAFIGLFHCRVFPHMVAQAATCCKTFVAFRALILRRSQVGAHVIDQVGMRSELRRAYLTLK